MNSDISGTQKHLRFMQQ
ncbi:MAG: hypothetical protein GWN00_35130, partial [Aliifodinibius sp.]|nr:hypothetical protein [Fodinibius sp.]NIV15886.1 hypothetical protein [Fodinibius sp.]NIY29833.1 hypothetical protein [Fodinibius sp.]